MEPRTIELKKFETSNLGDSTMEKIEDILKNHPEEFGKNLDEAFQKFVRKSLELIVKCYDNGKLDEILKNVADFDDGKLDKLSYEEELKKFDKELDMDPDIADVEPYFKKKTLTVIEKIISIGEDWWVNPKKAMETMEREWDDIPNAIKKNWENAAPEIMQTFENQRKTRISQKNAMEFKKLFINSSINANNFENKFSTSYKNFLEKKIDCEINVDSGKAREYVNTSIRFMPLKFCLAYLVFLINKKSINNAKMDIENFYFDFTDFRDSLKVGIKEYVNYLNTEPTLINEKKKTTGFPSIEDNYSMDRFLDTYLGRFEPDSKKNPKKTDGALHTFGLVKFYYSDEKGISIKSKNKLAVAISEKGIEFLKKQVDNESKMAEFNDDEAEFLLNQIKDKERFLHEGEIIQAVVKILKDMKEPEAKKDQSNEKYYLYLKKEETKRNEQIDSEIFKILKKIPNETGSTKALQNKARIIRISTLSRLHEIGLINWSLENGYNKYKFNIEKYDQEKLELKKLSKQENF